MFKIIFHSELEKLKTNNEFSLTCSTNLKRRSSIMISSSIHTIFNNKIKFDIDFHL